MDTGSGRGSCRTEVQPMIGGRVRIQDAPAGSREQLAHVESATRYVAAHVVRVCLFHLGRTGSDLREDPLAEAGRKSLYLAKDWLGHVDGRAIGDVAVRPDRVLPRRCTCAVEQALLCEQHERTRRVKA